MYFFCTYICKLRTQFDMGLVQTANKGYWRNSDIFVYISCCFSTCPLVFWRRTCVCFWNNETFSTFNSYFLWIVWIIAEFFAQWEKVTAQEVFTDQLMSTDRSIFRWILLAMLNRWVSLPVQFSASIAFGNKSFVDTFYRYLLCYHTCFENNLAEAWFFTWNCDCYAYLILVKILFLFAKT